MILLAFLVFIAGLLTFLAPCTLPVLPAYLAHTFQSGTASRFWRTLAFALGVMFTFLIFGIFAGSIGNALAEYKAIIAIASGILFILLGTFLLLGKELPGIQLNVTPKSTILGTFLFGVVFSLSWSGCIGPILGMVLVLAANTQTAITGGILLVVYALGLLTPLLLLSAYLDRVPKNGKLWRILRGRPLRFGTWEVHSTTFITGVMLLILGIAFIFRIDKLLTTSPIINYIFTAQESVAALLGISLP
jgi:cytochrome c-type biogenesis protein